MSEGEGGTIRDALQGEQWDDPLKNGDGIVLRNSTGEAGRHVSFSDAGKVSRRGQGEGDTHHRKRI